MSQLAEFDRLMADVVAGSEDAVWELAETYTPYIIRAVRLSLSPRLRSKLDSHDLAQTLWASILLKRTDLTRLKTPAELIAYLAQATRNKVIDKTRHFHTAKHSIEREEKLDEYLSGSARQKSRSRIRPVYSREPTPSTMASLRERWGQILSNASERDRQVLRLRIEGCTFEVISVKLQIDKETARRTIERLVKQLSG